MPAKMSNEQLGVLLPVEVISFFGDEALSDEVVGMVLRRLLFPSIEVEERKGGDAKTKLADLLARNLSIRFKSVNESRLNRIEHDRQSKREWARGRSKNNPSASSGRTLSQSIDSALPSIVGLEEKRIEENSIYISPVSPQAGKERLPPKISPEDILASTAAGFEAIAVDAAEKLAANHPRGSRPTYVSGALLSILKKNCADAQAAQQLVSQIESRHAEWLRSAEWAREGGRFVPRLSRWLRNGDWAVPPPAKKTAPEVPEYQDPKVDCSPEVI